MTPVGTMKTCDFKEKVKNYWNVASCGTEFIDKEKYSKDYFDAIEDFRYKVEPEIFSFAQFSRFRNKKILEVGVGAGTDFVQWVRSGCESYGIDLTEEALINTQNRLVLENINAKQLLIADAENLPFESNFFDLVYSWGVIHHSSEPFKALAEIIRVTKPSGIIKIMIYNRHSLFAFYRWVKEALLKFRPFRSLKNVIFYNQESYGTKAYTRKEVLNELKKLNVDIMLIDTTVTNHDLLYYKSKSVKFYAKFLAVLLGWQRVGWFMKIELKKK